MSLAIDNLVPRTQRQRRSVDSHWIIGRDCTELSINRPDIPSNAGNLFEGEVLVEFLIWIQERVFGRDLMEWNHFSHK